MKKEEIEGLRLALKEISTRADKNLGQAYLRVEFDFSLGREVIFTAGNSDEIYFEVYGENRYSTGGTVMDRTAISKLCDWASDLSLGLPEEGLIYGHYR